MTFNEQFPLTPMQQGMLYQWRLAPTSGVNLEQMIIHCPHPLDMDHMKQAWLHLAAHHQALRLAMEWSNGDKPTQHDSGRFDIPFEHDDFSSTQDNPQRLFSQYLKRDRRRGFELDRPPLWRVHCFNFGDHWRMVWSFHHIILDGRSFPILLRELFEIYDDLLAGKAVTVTENTPFANYARYLADYDFNVSNEFWRHHLSDIPDQELPHPHRSAPQTTRLEAEQLEHTQYLEPHEVERLQQFAAANNATLHTLLQAAWAMTLAAHGAGFDIVFGSVRACRHLPIDGVKDMVGMLINTLPFRLRLNPNQTLSQLLGVIRKTQLDFRDHEVTPLSKIMEWCLGGSGGQLFTTMLMFENQTLSARMQALGGDWSNRRIQLLEKTEFPLALAAYLDQSLCLTIEYNMRTYSSKGIAVIGETLLTLLRHFPAGDLPLHNLPIVPAGKLPQLSQDHLPPHEGIHQAFERWAAKQPDALALREDRGDYTYGQLNRRANHLANALRARGLGPGQFAGLAMERSATMIVTMLAILKSGAAYVPLDPNYPQDRLLMMLEDTNPLMVLIQRHLMDMIPVEAHKQVVIESFEHEFTNHGDHNPAETYIASSRCAVIFTSGSTGRPKGVVLSHGAVTHYLRTVIDLFELAPGNRIPQFSTINFDVHMEEIFGALCSGSTLVLPDLNIMDSLDRILTFVEREEISYLNVTTLLWQELIHRLTERGDEFAATLRIAVCGGERATRSAYNNWLQVGGDRIRWMNCYGPTETCSMTSWYEFPDKKPAEWDPPIGWALPGTHLLILDRWGRVTPQGVPGEIHIGGKAVTEGYLHRPDFTADRFKPNPFSPGRLYASGDLGMVNEQGCLEYLDRMDNQIKLRGYRIELGEIEQVLHSHAGVMEGLVLPQKTQAGATRLIAYAQKRPGFELTEESVLNHFNDSLPEFMRPSAAVIIREFPKTPGGKVDRRALPNPKPPERSGDPWAGITMDATTGKVRDLWETVLGVSPLGPADNFFENGGDSLKAMRLSSMMEEAMGKPVPLALLLSAPTLSLYANSLGEEIEEFQPLVNMAAGDDKRPPLFLVHSLGGDILIYRRLAESINLGPVYGLQMYGLDRKTPPHQSIEEAARDFLIQIRTIQVTGPYALAGYSSGGVIAFEMARQLRELGEQVSFLGLFDSGMPPIAEARFKPSPPIFAWHFMANLRHFLPEILKKGPAAVLNRIKKEYVKRRPSSGPRQQANWEGENLDAMDLSEHFAADMSHFPRYRIMLMKTHFHAIATYDPAPYQGKLHLFRTRRQPVFRPQNLYLGWNHLTHNDIPVTTITGNHEEMLDDPHVGMLGQALREAMIQAGLDRELIN